MASTPKTRVLRADSKLINVVHKRGHSEPRFAPVQTQRYLDKWKRRKVVLAAIALDLLFGEPPNRYHPVAWMGRVIAMARKFVPKRGLPAQLVYGGLISPGGALIVAVLGDRLSGVLDKLPGPLSWLAEAVALKMTISVRSLNAAACEVETALTSGNVPEARRLLSWHLVSRDTSALDSSQIASAAIESIAENFPDGIAAPLVYYLMGGLPAALLYRFANTGDAMLGYHDAEREWLGKLPARFDDVLNLLPSRLSAGLIVSAAFVAGHESRSAWHIWRRDNGRTASPNAGHPMSAMAGALGVQLEKIDHYRLGGGQRLPMPADIGRARRLMLVSVGLLACLLLAIPRD